ncbi:helix-turn-helix domain-containing protein [Mycobacterium sp. 94-17]|uniref:helix-turn-helix domain-containing protein n=1 Tax=Mycobacterium sp. 94-17 TaxID=2986147 RepID=UPI002D1EB784|nr:helix-turn-helix domain-containing protein [Mycobacterium sp. 94-17]MEB4210523.1 helix-turn-helix domain-containing protein [Mycobacterium sp. 94-17]
MTALLRAVRKQRGLTLEALARQTGLTKSYLSKIERECSTPSIAVALKVASALDVDVGRLFSEDAAQEKITVEQATGDAGGERYRALASSLLGKTMAPFVIRPTRHPVEGPHPAHAGQEFMFVHAGTVELDYGDQTFTLVPGDSAYFDASVSHTIRAVGAERAEVVVVAAEPR